MNDLMIDIETLGNTSNSCILSIAAVPFNIETGESDLITFERNIDLQSCLDLGMTVTGSTFYWWLEQGSDAKNKILKSDHVSINEALSELSIYINETFKNDKFKIWGNSPRFDLGILSDAYNKINVDIPWNFRNERCVRTLSAFDPKVKNNIIKEWKGVKHDPIDDCILQIKYCSKIYNKLTAPRE